MFCKAKHIIRNIRYCVGGADILLMLSCGELPEGLRGGRALLCSPVVRVGAQRAVYLVYFKIAIIVSMVFLAVIKHVSTPFFFTLNVLL